MARQTQRIDQIRRIIYEKGSSLTTRAGQANRKKWQIILQKGFVFQEYPPNFSMNSGLLLFKLPLISSLQAMTIEMEVLLAHNG
jgi:hypothetical protein